MHQQVALLNITSSGWTQKPIYLKRFHSSTEIPSQGKENLSFSFWLDTDTMQETRS
jgi:hypothetical protein